MDNQTNESQQSIQPANPAAPVPPAPVAEGQNVVPQPATAKPSGIPVPSDPEDEEDGSRKSMLIKIGIAFVIIIIVAVILFVFVLSRLFSGNPKSEKATVVWWGLWEDPPVVKSIIDSFQREYPNITVQYVKQDPKQYSERLIARIQNGTGPDVFRYHVSWLPMMQFVLSPLSSDAITPQDFQKNFYPVMQKDLVKNGAIYGIPLEIETLSLFINDQLFQTTGLKPPENWTDFITAARALTVKDANGSIKTAGAALGTFDNITHAPDVVSLLLFQNGADPLDLENTKHNTSDALTFYTSFAKDQTKVWSGDLDASIIAFSKGNLGMYFGYSYDVFNIKALNQNLSFSIHPVPHLLGRTMTVASY